MKDTFDHITEYYLNDTEHNIKYSPIFVTDEIDLTDSIIQQSNDIVVQNIKRSTFFQRRIEDDHGIIKWAREIDGLKRKSSLHIQDKNPIEKNKVTTASYGVFLFEMANGTIYAVSYGYASAMLSSYCNYNFGLDLAERLLTNHTVDVESLRYVNINRKKSITVFASEAVSPIEYGSADEYVKGRVKSRIFTDPITKAIIDKLLTLVDEKFEFGTSVKIVDKKNKRKTAIDSIENLGEVISLIDAFLTRSTIEDSTNSSIMLPIPRLNYINQNDDKNKPLDDKLLKAIENENIDVNLDFYSVIGAEIVINDGSCVKMSCSGLPSITYTDISIKDIKAFMFKNTIKSPSDILNSADIIFEDNRRRKLKRCLIADIIVSDITYILVDGKWATYNETFVKYINKEIKSIDDSKIINLMDHPFSTTDIELAEYYRNKGSSKFKRKYREFIYNTWLEDMKGYKRLDTDNYLIKKYPNVEIADLLSVNEIIHVKIGDPGRFIENIEQSILAATVMHESESKDDLVENKKTEKRIADRFTVSMLLVFKDKTIEDFSFSNINSIKFKASLIEWYKTVMNMQLLPKIYIAHLQGCGKKFAELIEDNNTDS
jgi:hypothetical protein